MDYSSRTQRRAGIGFAIFAVLTLGVILLGHWEPRADFDVIGILWLMQNILPLILFSVFFAGATGAAAVWLRCKIHERRREH